MYMNTCASFFHFYIIFCIRLPIISFLLKTCCKNCCTYYTRKMNSIKTKWFDLKNWKTLMKKFPSVFIPQFWTAAQMIFPLLLGYWVSLLLVENGEGWQYFNSSYLNDSIMKYFLLQCTWRRIIFFFRRCIETLKFMTSLANRWGLWMYFLFLSDI